ncbi:MAG: ATP-dependent DNA helicase RecG, partial [Chthoniobacterales bacterium]|nr:ATP-dependent DNA helicase RecG [Chthoniobacterales bacterium]
MPVTIPVKNLKWIPNSKKSYLARIGINTLKDLLLHFPRRYEDRTQFFSAQPLESDSPVCLFGIVVKTSFQRYGHNPPCFEAEIEPQHANVFSHRWTCRWFNSRYLAKIISVNDKIVIYGKIRIRRQRIYLDHPEFEIIEELQDSIHFGRITPIYPCGDGLNSRLLREWIFVALQEFDPKTIPDILPPKEIVIPREEALQNIHFPPNFETLEKARKQFVLEEFFKLQCLLARRRQRALSSHSTPKIVSRKLLNKFLSQLPFSLTTSQQEVLEELLAEIAEPRPMRRLLQGDVGSGKTVIAAACAIATVEAGWQVALMAPTQILANQHFKNFQRWLSPLGISVSLVTSDQRTLPGELPLFSSPFGGDVIIGTHALLYESTPLPKLGLVIIDEQHKFGVEQRARLLNRGICPDLLIMTATPIPRTLTQTIHGDLDVSFIRERPALRGTIKTLLRPSSHLPQITSFLRNELSQGRQAYIVYPLIEESEKIQAAAATERYEFWKQALAPYTVELLHGRMPADAKEKTMQLFHQGEISVLVSTTVVEVGLDVPNATVMVIENAERFGLAQLHQLRGRVGRGQLPSTCFLIQSE